MAQAIEAEGLPVVRKLESRRARSSAIARCDRATSTCTSNTPARPSPPCFIRTCRTIRARAFEQARQLYARGGVTALEPLGFNNTFAILVRTADARRLGLRSIADLRGVAGGWTPGFGYEFLQRADGYPGLTKAYGLSFGGAARAMDLSLIYKALADGQVDVIAGDATSAQIDALDLTALDDSLHYFPPYDAAPVVRTATAPAAPGSRAGHGASGGQVTEKDMRAMNRAVDVDRRDPRDVARRFLATLTK